MQTKYLIDRIRKAIIRFHPLIETNPTNGTRYVYKTDEKIQVTWHKKRSLILFHCIRLNLSNHSEAASIIPTIRLILPPKKLYVDHLKVYMEVEDKDRHWYESELEFGWCGIFTTIFLTGSPKRFFGYTIDGGEITSADHIGQSLVKIKSGIVVSGEEKDNTNNIEVLSKEEALELERKKQAEYEAKRIVQKTEVEKPLSNREPVKNFEALLKRTSGFIISRRKNGVEVTPELIAKTFKVDEQDAAWCLYLFEKDNA